MMKVQDTAKITHATSFNLLWAWFLEVLCYAGNMQGTGAAQPSVDPLQHMLIAIQIR